MRQIRIYSSAALTLTRKVMIFRDWYCFADYVKEENLHGRPVIIHKWEYFRPKAEEEQ